MFYFLLHYQFLHLSLLLVAEKNTLSSPKGLGVVVDAHPELLLQTVTNYNVHPISLYCEFHPFIQFLHCSLQLERDAEVLFSLHRSKHFGGTYQLEAEFLCSLDLMR